MAHLTRQTVTQPIPAKAKIITKNGESFAVWIDKKNRKIKALLSECHTRCTVTLPEWYMEYRDEAGKAKRVKLFTSRRKSQIRMGELLKELEQGEIIIPTTTRGVHDCIRDWIEHLKAKRANETHIGNCQTRITNIIDALKASTPKAINPQRLEQWLAQQRRKATIPNARTDKFSVQTSNHYLKTAKAFCNYLVKHDILTKNPLVVVDALNAEHCRTFERRALSNKELWHLINTTIKQGRRFCCLAPVDRAYCYVTAAYTGFRLNELSHLTPASFLLEGETPVVVLSGQFTKNGEDARQPLPPKVAKKLQKYLKTKKPEERMWDSHSWSEIRHATRALNDDLKRAGIPRLDSQKRRFDVHAFRTHYITSLALAKIPIQHATKLARLSSVEIMMKHYAKIGVSDLSEQINLIDIE